MADETVATEAPKKLGTSAFHYEVSPTFTGLVQFRVGAGAEIDAPPSGIWREGEVKKIGREDFAWRLVAGGMHAHAPADTPLGQPVEYRNDPTTLKLRDLGYSNEAIGAMTPQQVKDALAAEQAPKSAITPQTTDTTEGEE